MVKIHQNFPVFNFPVQILVLRSNLFNFNEKFALMISYSCKLVDKIRVDVSELIITGVFSEYLTRKYGLRVELVIVYVSMMNGLTYVGLILARFFILGISNSS